MKEELFCYGCDVAMIKSTHNDMWYWYCPSCDVCPDCNTPLAIGILSHKEDCPKVARNKDLHDKLAAMIAGWNSK